jgi:hypothetical protein
MGTYLVVIWLLAGLAALVTEIRLRDPSAPRTVSLALFLLALAAGGASAVLPQPVASACVWITLGSVNTAVALRGVSRGTGLLAVVGLGLTAAALGLALLRAQLSLPLIAAAGVIVLGALVRAPAAWRVRPN